MTDAEKLQHLAGDVSGLRMVIMALVNTHPQPMELLAQLDRLFELQIGLTIGTTVTEDFLTEQAKTMDTFRAHVHGLIQRGA